MKVNGETAVFGVVGDPIKHTLSPQIHANFAEICGINMVYVPFNVKDNQSSIKEAIRGAHALGIKGLNVTVPHKKAVMPYLSSVDDMAQKVGAVNTLVWTQEGYVGYNTDYIGIKRTLTSLGTDFENKNVVVFGAGGSAYAACIAAADGNAKSITVVNRTKENADILISHVKAHYNIPIDVVVEVSKLDFSCDIAIQTTTLGFGENLQKSPIVDINFFKGIQLAFDIIYTPKETMFLRQAREAGVETVNGFPMLIYQAAAAFSLWHKRDILDEEFKLEKFKRLYLN